MKRFLAVLFLLVLMLGLGTAVVYATPTPTPPVEGIDLAPLDLTWSGEVNPGDKTTFVLTYANKGTETIPADTSTKFTLALKTIDDDEEVVSSVSDPFSVAGMVFGETRIVTSTLIVPEEKVYTIEATIESLSNEADEENNSLRKTFNVSSALPPEIANLFAGLGMFAAVMAVVAVGTEVVVDSVRVALGLKRKVTALEALDKLKDEIPGKLSELGVAAPKVEEFNNTIGQLKTTLQTPIKISTMTTSIRDGQLGQMLSNVFVTALANNLANALKKNNVGEISSEEVVMVIDTLLAAEPENFFQEILNDNLQINGNPIWNLLGAEDVATKFVENEILSPFKISAKGELNKLPQTISNWLEDITKSLNLSDSLQGTLIGAASKITNSQIDLLESEIDNISMDTIHDWLTNIKLQFDDIYAQMATIGREQGPEAVADWLAQQGDTLLINGNHALMEKFEQDLKPVLKAIGLQDASIDKTKNQLVFLGSEAQAASAVYLSSLKKLLLAVEDRRNDMQSPFRKAWRALRKSSFTLIPTIIVVLAWIFIVILTPLFKEGGPGFVISFLLAVGVLASLLGVVAWVYEQLLKSADKKLKDKQLSLSSITDFGLLRREIMSLENGSWKQMMVKKWLENENLRSASKGGDVRNYKAYNWLSYYLTDTTNLAKVKTSEPEGVSKVPGNFKFWLIGVGDFLTEFESAWNFVIGRPNDQGKVESGITKLIENLDQDIAGTEVAAILQLRADQHRDEEASRLRWLRVISLIIGIWLAYLLKIDAAELLDAIIPEVSEKINAYPITKWPFSVEEPLRAGMILTGLAASAGSAFWHDQLDRLQAAKRGAEEAAKLIREVQGSNIGAGSQQK